MNMVLAHAVVAAAILFIVFLLGLGAAMAFKLISKSSTEPPVKKVDNTVAKPPVLDIEDLDITKVLK
jgi:hypothetical protein